MANQTGERREIPGFPGYLITEDGQLFKLIRRGAVNYDTATPVAVSSDGKVVLSGPEPTRACHTFSVSHLVSTVFPKASDELATLVGDELADFVRSHKMTDEEREAQAKSFAYGNVAIDNPTITKEMVDAAATERKTRSKKAGS